MDTGSAEEAGNAVIAATMAGTEGEPGERSERAAGPVPRTPRAEVRERILAAAEAEFFGRGYRNSSLAGIARRAGFTKGAVYSNFESKQALLGTMLAERSARASRTALDRLSGDDLPAGALAARAADVLADEVLRPAAALLLTELALHAVSDATAARSYTQFRRAQQQALAGALADHAEALGLRADADLRGAAFLLVTLMSSLAVERAVDPESADRPRVVAALTTVLSALIDEAARPQAP